MPTNQIQQVNYNGHSTGLSNRPGPINKLPTPPPPLPPYPKTQVPCIKGPPPPPPPPPLPPPPPRNTSHHIGHIISTNVQSYQGLISSSSHASSLNSLNSLGRCYHNTQQIQPGIQPSVGHNNQRNLTRPALGDNCSSRSSISSHNSLQHNHLTNHVTPVGHVPVPYTCQSGVLNCHCSQHSHINSGNTGDNVICGYNLNQDNRLFAPNHHCSNCCHVNNHHNLGIRYQGQNITSSSSKVGNANVWGHRPHLMHCTGSNNSDNSYDGHNDSNRLCMGHPHSHTIHHHRHHGSHHSIIGPSLQSSPSVESDHQNRCAMIFQGGGTGPSQVVSNDQVSKQVANHCFNHNHRGNGCDYHHHSFCDHSSSQPQLSHVCGGCTHSHNSDNQSECGRSIIDRKPTGITYPGIDENIQTSNLSDCPIQETIVNSTHNHNLSNSSTTTHTGNVIQNLPPSNRSIVPKNVRSSSSQHYDQYGLSSAASTSSATASLSSYHGPATFEDRSARDRMLGPMPPSMSRSRNGAQPHPVPDNRIAFRARSEAPPVITTTFLENGPQPQQICNPPLPPLPPLPPKQISPNSCSSQIATLTNCNYQNHCITRVTSQAGVQNPLPDSDIPPPLPPLNPGSRVQMNLNNQTEGDIGGNSHITSTPGLVNSTSIDARRRVESKKVDTDLLRKQQHQQILPKLIGESYGTCAKCGHNVVPNQEACKAMDQIFHASCFACCSCNKTLVGKIFYPVGDKVYCEDDFMVSVDLFYNKIR